MSYYGDKHAESSRHCSWRRDAECQCRPWGWTQSSDVRDDLGYRVSEVLGTVLCDRDRAFPGECKHCGTNSGQRVPFSLIETKPCPAGYVPNDAKMAQYIMVHVKAWSRKDKSGEAVGPLSALSATQRAMLRSSLLSADCNSIFLLRFSHENLPNLSFLNRFPSMFYSHCPLSACNHFFTDTCYLFTYFWQMHTHTLWARIPEIQVRIPSRAMGTFFPHTVSSIFRLSLTHVHRCCTCSIVSYVWFLISFFFLFFLVRCFGSFF